MKILSSIQNNFSKNFYNDPKDAKVFNGSDEEMDVMLNSQIMTKMKKTTPVLSNNEQNTLHLFFGTQVPDDMKLYGQNNIKQIHKGQLLDLRG